LEDEKVELTRQLHDNSDEDSYRDWDDQIAHWKATLAGIQAVIAKEKLR
jgi:hypothetical protein